MALSQTIVRKILLLLGRQIINIFVQDWPDCMTMDEKMFANYAEQLEKEDFEDEVCPEMTPKEN